MASHITSAKTKPPLTQGLGRTDFKKGSSDYTVNLTTFTLDLWGRKICLLSKSFELGRDTLKNTDLEMERHTFSPDIILVTLSSGSLLRTWKKEAACFYLTSKSIPSMALVRPIQILCIFLTKSISSANILLIIPINSYYVSVCLKNWFH